MGQHRIGVRVDLSPAAEKRFLQACKVQGGQTRFVEEAIEHYVHQLDVMEKLNSIENLLRQLIGSGQIVQLSATEISSSPKSNQEQHQNVAQEHTKEAHPVKPDILDPSQRESAYSTLRAFLGDGDQ